MDKKLETYLNSVEPFEKVSFEKIELIKQEFNAWVSSHTCDTNWLLNSFKIEKPTPNSFEDSKSSETRKSRNRETFKDEEEDKISIELIEQKCETWWELYMFFETRFNGYKSRYKILNDSMIHKQTFSKIQKRFGKPSINIAIMLCIGLELTYNESVLFLQYANLAFNPKNKSDRFIVNKIQNHKSGDKDYNMQSIEREMHKYGLAPYSKQRNK